MLVLADDPVFSNQLINVSGLICTYISSIIVPPTRVLIAVTSLVDEYGMRLLLNSNAQCKILILDSQAYARFERLFKKLLSESWMIIPTVIRIHAKFYVSIDSVNSKYCAYAAVGSANLGIGEVLCHSVNNLALYYGCMGKDKVVEWLRERLQAYLPVNQLEDLLTRLRKCL